MHGLGEAKKKADRMALHVDLLRSQAAVLFWIAALSWGDSYAYAALARLLRFACDRLQVILHADLAQHVDLGFQEVDVFFGIVENLQQQICLLYTSPSPRD